VEPLARDGDGDAVEAGESTGAVELEGPITASQPTRERLMMIPRTRAAPEFDRAVNPLEVGREHLRCASLLRRVSKERIPSPPDGVSRETFVGAPCDFDPLLRHMPATGAGSRPRRRRRDPVDRMHNLPGRPSAMILRGAEPQTAGSGRRRST
jgi:hypothetical protein